MITNSLGVFGIVLLQGAVFATIATLVVRKWGATGLALLSVGVVAVLEIRGYRAWYAAALREIPLPAIVLSGVVPIVVAAVTVFAFPRTRVGAVSGVAVAAVLYLITRALSEVIGIYYLG